jgi:hypothetical protein
MTYIVPILEAIMTTIVNMIGVLNSYFLTKIHKLNKQIDEETMTVSTHAIGFAPPSDDNPEEEDEDDF